MFTVEKILTRKTNQSPEAYAKYVYEQMRRASDVGLKVSAKPMGRKTKIILHT